MTVPVVFLVFNRPALTAQVFARIRGARPARLFVVADGPRADRPDDAKKCADVRRIIEDGVDWPCEVVRDYSDVNLGCGRRVATGITNAFLRVEEAIILEDDCVPDPSFFPFCEELLARYRNEPKVAQIAGCSFQDPAGVPKSSSYYFSRYPHCWGWATWRRAWQCYDHEMSAWRTPGTGWLTQSFEHAAERKWWELNFTDTAQGRIDTWDFRWTVVVLSQQWLCILPYRNLVSNIGGGPEATHTKGTGGVMALPIQEMLFPLDHPTVLERSLGPDEHSSRRLFRVSGLGRRFLLRLKHWCRLP